MENIPDTPEGIILEALLEGMNQYYSAELSQKVLRGMNESRQKGHFTGGNIPYGYKVVNKKFVVDEDEAEVVRYIYEQYSLDTYVRDIIDTLTKRGILCEGKPFRKTSVYYMLQNEKYTGIYRYNGMMFDNCYCKNVSFFLIVIVQKKKRKAK